MSDFPLAELSTVVTTGPFYGSSESSGTFGEMAADVGSNGSELLSVSCVGSTVTAAVDATSGDPLGIIIIFKDTMPYSRTENRASRFYQQLQHRERDSEFPVVLCDGQESASAVKDVFGSCNREKMLDTLSVLEKLIESKGDDEIRS